MSHSNISIFVPHLGCPHQCSFCNQRHITGQSVQPSAEDVKNAVGIAIDSERYDPADSEIAFFGGSFTAIERDYMKELLGAAKIFVDSGTVSGIRISTRPDCISPDVLSLLNDYGVTAIELGAQSMCDDVLAANKRGHKAEDVVYASRLIKNSGFELGLQMMTGLYKSDDDKDIFTAEKLIALSPDTVRIYPTITLKNTDLADLFISGEYMPPELSGTVRLCVNLEKMFTDAGIRVIRVGLHSIEKDSYVAGPWHPSFHELCVSLSYRDVIEKSIISGGDYVIEASLSDLSKIIGHKKENIIYFAEKNIHLRVVPSAVVPVGDFKIKEVR